MVKKRVAKKRVAKKIGLIGVGHLGKYLVEGFSKSKQGIEFHLSDPNPEKIKSLVSRHGGSSTTNNQEVVDDTRIIILATRPDDIVEVLSGLTFKNGQIVVSVAAGISLKTINSIVYPAKAVRVLPISCVAINKSPILMYPENNTIKDLFSLVGHVHILPNEKIFSPGTSLVGAFYAWLFLLMDETSSWATQAGINSEMARQLVIQTMEGACGMASEQNNMELKEIWKTLATPGGISELGANVLTDNNSITGFSDALNTVTDRLKN